MPDIVVDLVTAVVGGIMASLLWLLILSWFRPQIEISSVIAVAPDSSTGADKYVIKLINHSRRGVLEIKCELMSRVMQASGVYDTNAIEPKKLPPLLIPGTSRGSTTPSSFRLTYGIRSDDPHHPRDLRDLLAKDDKTHLRFRVYAKDATSGIGRIFECKYYLKDLLDGEFAKGYSLEVPAEPREASRS